MEKDFGRSEYSLEDEIKGLDRTLDCLGEMKNLAERAMEDDCTSTERRLLQEDMEFCRKRANHLYASSLQSARTKLRRLNIRI